MLEFLKHFKNVLVYRFKLATASRQERKQQKKMIMLSEQIICNGCTRPKETCPKENGSVVKVNFIKCN